LKSVLLKIISPLSKRERNQLLILSFADFILSITDLLFTGALIYLISNWKNVEANDLIPVQVRNPFSILLICFILFLLKNIIAYLLQKKQYDFIYQIATQLSAERLSKTLDADYETYVTSHSSKDIRFISQEPIEYAHYVLRSLQIMISNMALLIFTVIVIMMYSKTFSTWVVFLFIPPVLLFTWIAKKQLSRAKLNAKIFGETSLKHLQEAINGYVEANINSKKDFFITRYSNAQHALNQNLSYQLLSQALPARLLEVFIIGGILIYIIFSKSEPDLFNLGVFVAACYKIIPGISRIMSSSAMIRSYTYTFDTPNADRSINRISELREEKINEVEFFNVGYSIGQKQIISNFSIKMKRGDFLQLKGFSGKGKTSLLNLMLGFLEPGHGHIRFNGKIMSASQRRAYWPVISYIRQEPFFINDTIEKNICLDNDFDKERINKLVQLTGLDKCFSRHIGGEKTLLFENARNLSGGEKQRLILARALYKEADLIILDEPFNELDETALSEMYTILKAVAASGKIICLVSHNHIEAPYSHSTVLE
jgi:ABC-type multidrug transport system fused ATPase/permease subunit